VYFSPRNAYKIQHASPLYSLTKHISLFTFFKCQYHSFREKYFIFTTAFFQYSLLLLQYNLVWEEISFKKRHHSVYLSLCKFGNWSLAISRVTLLQIRNIF
jgi:hypothetical protein